MAETEVSTTRTMPMNDVAEGLRGLRIAFVNVFGIENASGDWVLIDAGIPFSATQIRSWAERQFHPPPAALVLTHGTSISPDGAQPVGDHPRAPRSHL